MAHFLAFPFAAGRTKREPSVRRAQGSCFGILCMWHFGIASFSYSGMFGRITRWKRNFTKLKVKLTKCLYTICTCTVCIAVVCLHVDWFAKEHFYSLSGNEICKQNTERQMFCYEAINPTGTFDHIVRVDKRNEFCNLH